MGLAPSHWTRVEGGPIHKARIGAMTNWVHRHIVHSYNFHAEEDGRMVWCFEDSKDAVLFKLVWG